MCKVFTICANVTLTGLSLVIWNKFEGLTTSVTGNVETLTISETKLGNSFPEEQFLIDGYNKPFSNVLGGGVMLYVRRYSIKTYSSREFC